MRQLHWAGAAVSVLFAATGLGLPGCGGSTANRTSDEGGLVGMGGAGGSGGTGTAMGGSTSGAGGQGVDAGGGGGGASGATMTCGTHTCMSQALMAGGAGSITLPPCCPTEAPDQCGVLNTQNNVCISKVAGTPDQSCPTAAIMGITLQGCCMTNGFCGVDAALAGLGCTSAVSIDISGTMMASTPKACGGSAVDASVDAPPPDAIAPQPDTTTPPDDGAVTTDATLIDASPASDGGPGDDGSLGDDSSVGSSGDAATE